MKILALLQEQVEATATKTKLAEKHQNNLSKCKIRFVEILFPLQKTNTNQMLLLSL